MKMILKECVDKDGCKGRDYVHKISRLMKNSKISSGVCHEKLQGQDISKEQN